MVELNAVEDGAATARQRGGNGGAPRRVVATVRRSGCGKMGPRCAAISSRLRSADFVVYFGLSGGQRGLRYGVRTDARILILSDSAEEFARADLPDGLRDKASDR